MTTLILGLLIFLLTHSFRIFFEPVRTKMVARIGLMPWKAIYGVLSLIGLVLIVMGYGEARYTSPHLWVPPVQLRHIAILLMAVSFIFLVAAYFPGNGLKSAFGHPMLIAVKAWAIAHLLSNGSVADVVLFGSFLVWAVVDFIVNRKRDRAAGKTYPPGSAKRNILTVIIGLASWIVFAAFLHGVLIGVSPLGTA